MYLFLNEKKTFEKDVQVDRRKDLYKDVCLSLNSTLINKKFNKICYT